MSSSEKIDPAMIEQLKELLEDRFPELVERFVVDGEARVSLMRNAVSVQDFEVIYAEAHGLKGSSRNIGANTLGEACDVLEESGRVKASDGLESMFAAVEQEFAAVCVLLSSY